LKLSKCLPYLAAAILGKASLAQGPAYDPNSSPYFDQFICENYQGLGSLGAGLKSGVLAGTTKAYWGRTLGSESVSFTDPNGNFHIFIDAAMSGNKTALLFLLAHEEKHRQCGHPPSDPQDPQSYCDEAEADCAALGALVLYDEDGEIDCKVACNAACHWQLSQTACSGFVLGGECPARDEIRAACNCGGCPGL